MKLIDADKQIEWIKQELEKTPKVWPTSFDCGRGLALKEVMKSLESGTFDPTPPVQPDIKPGDKVSHKDKKFEPYGVGIVKEIAKSGKQAYVEWPNYNKQHFRAWGPPSPAYYRLDKLEVIQ